MRSIIGAGVLVCEILACGCGPNTASSPADQLKPENVVHPDLLAKAGLQYFWDMQISLKPGERIGRFFLMDENLYCITSSNNVYAVDASTGIFKWSVSVAEPGQTLFDPVHCSGMAANEKVPSPAGRQAGNELIKFDGVLFNTLDQVTVFDRARGRLMRKFDLGFPANSAGTTDGIYYYAGGTDGQFYCLRINDCIKMWKLGMDYIDTVRTESPGQTGRPELEGRMVVNLMKIPQTELKRFQGPISAPLCYYNGMLFVGNDSGQFLAVKVDAVDIGQKAWALPASGGFHARCLVNSNGCFVACTDKRIYARQYSNGRQLDGWKDGPFITAGQVERSLQATAKCLFASATDALYAVNIATGRQMWKNADARFVVGAGRDRIYLIDKDNNLTIVNETSGLISTSLPMKGMALFAANTALERIFAVSSAGRIYCIAPAGKAGR